MRNDLAKDDFPLLITLGKKYGPAMQITDQSKADAYFEKCVRHTMSHGKSQQESEAIERSNLGYYAGYYDKNTRERVERLFHCAHPIFGRIADRGTPTAKEAFEAGARLAQEKSS